MGKHVISDLWQMQSLPLEAKIRMTKYRIRQWVEYYGEDGVYVSFSGGKDSTVLLDLVRQMYSNVTAVFVDTGLEYPEIREFVKTFSNVVWLKPKKNFKQVITEYGYPFISKEVSDKVDGARKYISAHTDIALDDINTVIEYEKNINSFVFGSMEVLSWLVFLFGVINLINTTLSNQMSRKQENSVLRSIGLTQKQLCKMNICEGLCYAFFATLATLIVGLPASIFACSKFSVGAFAGKVVPYKFPVLEMGLFILVLFGMELILSVWTVRRQKKQSLIEQMRAME